MSEQLTFGSLFAGIGGFDLGFERSGMKCIWQVEIDNYANRVLEKHWPDVRRHGDIKTFPPGRAGDWRVDVICGGDPCPAHSVAKGGKHSRSPDMSGYFLSVVGQCKPPWVVRENVPSPVTDDFVSALECLGYGAFIIQADASEITGQNRLREYVVGKYQATRDSVSRMFPERCDSPRRRAQVLGSRKVIPTLCVREFRASPRDCYIYDSGLFRTLDSEERESFTGFPNGWTSGFSKHIRCRLLGNAVVPQVAEWIGRRIIESKGVRT